MSSRPLPDGWRLPVLPEAYALWASTIRPPKNPVIYHYTSREALSNIVASRTMWATNLAFANDPSELHCARNVARDVLEEITAEYCADRVERRFLKRWLEGFDVMSRMFHRDCDFYSISFCEDSGVSSQWERYAAGSSGFCLGWKASSKFPSGGRRASVEYDVAEQRRIIRATVRLHVDDVLVSGRFESRDDWTTYHDWLTYSLAMQLNFYLYAFKHSSYASEQEIRFIYMTELNEPHPFDGPYVRQFRTMTKPYIVLDFSSAELAEVVYGPNSDPAPTEAWLRRLLDANGHHECAIRPAKIAAG